MKVNTIVHTVEWRWMNLVYVGVGSFILSMVWDDLLRRRDESSGSSRENSLTVKVARKLENKKIRISTLILLVMIVVLFPFVMSMYQTNIMITALMYVVLGLGLNIVVGFGGLLSLWAMQPSMLWEPIHTGCSTTTSVSVSGSVCLLLLFSAESSVS